MALFAFPIVWFVKQFRAKKTSLLVCVWVCVRICWMCKFIMSCSLLVMEKREMFC